MRRSALTSRGRRIKYRGRRIPTVRLIKRCKNVRPGTMTEHVKLSIPIKDCISLSMTFLRPKKSSINVLTNLSGGSRASILRVSSSIPANDITQLGPTVFFRRHGDLCFITGVKKGQQVVSTRRKGFVVNTKVVQEV